MNAIFVWLFSADSLNCIQNLRATHISPSIESADHGMNEMSSNELPSKYPYMGIELLHWTACDSYESWAYMLHITWMHSEISHFLPYPLLTVSRMCIYEFSAVLPNDLYIPHSNYAIIAFKPSVRHMCYYEQGRRCNSIHLRAKYCERKLLISLVYVVVLDCALLETKATKTPAIGHECRSRSMEWRACVVWVLRVHKGGF